MLLGRLCADGDRNVRHSLALEGSTALRTRIETLGHPATRPAVNGNPRDEEPVGIHVVVVLGVGNCGAQKLLKRFRGENSGELQKDQRFANALAANRVGDATELPRAHPGKAKMRDGFRTFGCGFHHFTKLLSPPWPR